MYDLLIIGGGLQGVFFAHALHSRGLIRADRIGIADPNESPAAVWRARCTRTGMDMLRSPSSHNLDPDYRTLRRYARSAGYSRDRHFLDPYARPSLQLFNEHLAHIIETDRLKESHLRCRVESVERTSRGFRSRTSAGTIDSRRILLAAGPGELNLPGFLENDRTTDPRIAHLFSGTDALDTEKATDSDPHARAASEGARILILGGGISAWQAALRYETLGANRVTLASPHPIRESIFDSHPCYMGPKCGREFARLSVEEKLERLKMVRYPGTLPPELAEKAREACRRGTVIDTLQMTAGGMESDADGIRATGEDGRKTDRYDYATAATGLTCEVPNRRFIDTLAEGMSLPVHKSGHPVLGDDLSWAPDFFVAGRPAELVIGPQAGNIVGAHLAFRRIRDSLANEAASQARMHPAGG